MKRFFSASDEQILEGLTTDVYFTRTIEVLRAKGMMGQQALSEFTTGDLPNNWKWGVFCGLEEVVRLMEGKNIDLWGLPEGTVFRARTARGIKVPVLTVNGSYSEYCIYETPMLGMMCHSSGIATMAARCKKAAGNKLVISFGIRRMHPSICPMIDRAAFIGGCDAVSSLLGAQTIGEKPRGTMPHALVIMFGDQKAAFMAFDEVVDKDIPRVALIDTYSDEKQEAIMACEAVKNLWGVRLDTPGSRKGSFQELIREVRWEMDIRGYKHVRIIVSGGIDEKVIPSLVEAGADGFGVGTSISNARTIDFAMDIVEKDGQPVAKRGKFGGRKYLFRCDGCLEYEVSLSRDDVPRCSKCQSEMRLAEIPIISGGKRVYEERTPREIRAYVLKQLEKVEVD